MTIDHSEATDNQAKSVNKKKPAGWLRSDCGGELRAGLNGFMRLLAHPTAHFRQFACGDHISVVSIVFRVRVFEEAVRLEAGVANFGSVVYGEGMGVRPMATS